MNIKKSKNAPLSPVKISRLLGASCCHSSKFSGSRCWAGTAQSWEAAAQCRHYSSSCNCIPPQSWPFLHLGINTGFSIWKSWIQPTVLETFYDILKLSLVLNHQVGWEHWLLGKKIDIPAQFNDKEWVFWSLLFSGNLRFDWFQHFPDFGFEAISYQL